MLYAELADLSRLNWLAVGSIALVIGAFIYESRNLFLGLWR